MVTAVADVQGLLVKVEGGGWALILGVAHGMSLQRWVGDAALQ